MSQIIADYEAERQAFESLFQHDCPQRILLVRGQSGSGKTHLLAHCQHTVPGTIVQVPIQLRGLTVTVAETFYRIAGRLGWYQLTTFTRQVAELQRMPIVKIDHNWLLGMNNHIMVALQADDPSDREFRRAALTEALFNDMRDLPQLVLVVFDTFEQGSAEVKEWISGPFLARIVLANPVRVVIAGQEVPVRHNIEWGQCCQERNLYGVREAMHWMPVVHALGRYIPSESPMEWLAGLCHALEGRPAAIAKSIDGLPRRGDLS